MSESKTHTIPLNVRLKPPEPSAYPCLVNYTHVGVAQGIAYLDFRFIEPALLTPIVQTSKDGQTAPKSLDSHLVTRVALLVDNLAQLHRQIQQLLPGLCTTPQQKPQMKREGMPLC